jgi:hypothetical protein
VLLVGLGLSFAVRVSAVREDYFIGHWVNVDNKTRGIMAVEIDEQDGHALMRAWGACDPSPCKWGQTEVSFLPPNVRSKDVAAATAVFRLGFAITQITMWPGKGGAIVVDAITHFTDNSGRPDYAFTGTFRLVPLEQWDSHMFN